MAELNNELNSLIRISLADYSNNYEKYSLIIFTAHARIFKNMKNTTITDILY